MVVLSKDVAISFDRFLSNELEKKWSGSIEIKLKRGIGGSFQKINVCDLIGNKYKSKLDDKLYFDTNEYPPPNKICAPSEDTIFPKLMKHIRRCAVESGSPLVSNGFEKRSNSSFTVYKRKFRCAFKYRQAQNTYKKPKNDENTHRLDSIINSDKCGRRNSGRKLCRRNESRLCDVNEKCCNFSLNILYDNHGYFLDERTGCAQHCSHTKIDPKLIPMPLKLLSEEERDNIRWHATACITSGSTCNYLTKRYGQFFERSKVAYANFSSAIVNEKIQQTDVDSLLDSFKQSNSISYQVLWDVPIDSIELQPFSDISSPTPNSTSCLKTTRSPFKLVSSVTDRSNNSNYYIDHTDESDFSEIQDSAEETRSTVNCDHKIFLCVAWSTLDEMKLFKKFPNVIFCDVTGDTNNSKNYLLSFCGRTPEGKTFVFLRVWIHNQRQGTFRWVFKVALKTFIKEDFYNKVQIVLVDGDRQQREELWNAVRDYLSKAKISTCMFHAVNQNWHQNGLSKNCIQNIDKTKYEDVMTNIFNWLYSFARHKKCETEDEFEVSKSLLYKYINSNLVLHSLENKKKRSSSS